MAYDNAWSHNCVYHEVDITEMWNSGEFSKNVADGSFKGIYPGCYIKKTKVIDGITYTDHIDIITSLDLYYKKASGSSYITTHHVGIVPFTLLGTSYMNSTNITTGGYKATYMRNTTLPKYLTGYKNAYGSDHFLSFNEVISSSVNTNVKSPETEMNGCVNGTESILTQITLLSEVQVYGSSVVSCGMDIGEANNQLEAFRFNHALQNFQNAPFWLRGITSTSTFAISYNSGSAGFYHSSGNAYVRPLLLLY